MIERSFLRESVWADASLFLMTNRDPSFTNKPVRVVWLTTKAGSNFGSLASLLSAKTRVGKTKEKVKHILTLTCKKIFWPGQHSVKALFCKLWSCITKQSLFLFEVLAKRSKNPVKTSAEKSGFWRVDRGKMKLHSATSALQIGRQLSEKQGVIRIKAPPNPANFYIR